MEKSQVPRLRSVHQALADPLRLRLLEYLWARARSAKELATLVGMPPDRLYHHLAQLEAAKLIRIAEYRPLPGGKVERVYAAADIEPPGDEASPVELAQFLAAALEATAADIASASRAKEAGERREIFLTRTAVRLSEERLRDLRAKVDALLQAAQEQADDAGVWTRIVWTTVDLQDRDPRSTNTPNSRHQ